MKSQITVLTIGMAMLSPAIVMAQSAPPAAPAEGSGPVPTSAPASTPPAAADRPATQPAAARTDNAGRRGFLMRVQIGGGYRSASAGDGSTAVDVSGSGVGFSLLMGGAVAESVFLYGEYMTEMTANPTIEVGQAKVVANETFTRLHAFGPGITYLMPQGMHVGGTLVFAQMSIERDGNEVASTKVGYGFSARVGKDFWLSPHYALGVVGQFTFATMPDRVVSPTAEPPNVAMTAFTLALSATYN
jgi:hypothetical protein